MCNVGKRASRGYTLIELMIVVAIIGAMAALAVFSVKKYMMSGRSRADADDAMAGVASAIRAYYDANRGYLDCSGSYTDLYPMTPSDKKHWFYLSSAAQYPCWKLYNVKLGLTYLSFSVKAGTAGTAPPAPVWCPNATAPTFPPTSQITKPWFVLMGMADLNNDGNYAYYLTSSFEPGEIKRCNEGE